MVRSDTLKISLAIDADPFFRASERPVRLTVRETVPPVRMERHQVLHNFLWWVNGVHSAKYLD